MNHIRFQADRISRLLKTGQTTSYHDGDDGDLEKGVARSYSVLTAGQYSGTTNIVINGKTHALSNECVKDNRTDLMWARYVPGADIGPATDGKLFWDQWTLASKIDISFDNATGEIRSAASEFSTGALCVGRKFTIAGSASNDATYTVASILAGAITTVEGVADEAAGATISVATVDDLIWNFVDQANANSLGGYTDWRVPNMFELYGLIEYGVGSPTIDTTAFPSSPVAVHQTTTTHPTNSAYNKSVGFADGAAGSEIKKIVKLICRLVRGSI